MLSTNANAATAIQKPPTKFLETSFGSFGVLFFLLDFLEDPVIFGTSVTPKASALKSTSQTACPKTISIVFGSTCHCCEPKGNPKMIHGGNSLML